MDALNLLQNPHFSPDKPGKALLFNAQHMRVAAFYLQPGQEISPHTSSSEVLMQVVKGSGSFIVGKSEIPVSTGSVVVCASEEAHGFKAKEQMVVMAVISPVP